MTQRAPHLVKAAPKPDGGVLPHRAGVRGGIFGATGESEECTKDRYHLSSHRRQTTQECPTASPQRLTLRPTDPPTELLISEPGSVLEQEAERIAATMATDDLPSTKVATSPRRIQRLVHRDSAGLNRNRSKVNAVLQQPGQPLQRETKQFMGTCFGYDFSRVRVHTNEMASKAADSVQASAFTFGHNVVFGAGQYRPESGVGRKLIAHELTHVVQQDSLHRPSVPHESKENSTRRQTKGSSTAYSAESPLAPIVRSRGALCSHMIHRAARPPMQQGARRLEIVIEFPEPGKAKVTAQGPDEIFGIAIFEGRNVNNRTVTLQSIVSRLNPETIDSSRTVEVHYPKSCKVTEYHTRIDGYSIALVPYEPPAANSSKSNASKPQLPPPVAQQAVLRGAPSSAFSSANRTPANLPDFVTKDPADMSGTEIEYVSNRLEWEIDQKIFSSAEAQAMQRQLVRLGIARAERHKGIDDTRRIVDRMARQSSATELLIPGFGLGVFAGAKFEVPDNDWSRLRLSLAADPAGFSTGMYIGMWKGELKALWGAIEGLFTLAFRPFKMVYETLDGLADYARRPPESEVESEARTARRAELVEAVGTLVSQIASDPMLGHELGVAAGRQAGQWFTDEFMKLSAYEKGLFIGALGSQILMEIVMLVLGPEEIALELANMSGKAAKAGGSLRRLVLELMEKIPVFKKMLDARKYSAAAKGAKGALEAANVGKSVRTRATIPQLRKMIANHTEYYTHRTPKSDVAANELVVGTGENTPPGKAVGVYVVKGVKGAGYGDYAVAVRVDSVRARPTGRSEEFMLEQAIGPSEGVWYTVDDYNAAVKAGPLWK